MNSGGIEIPRWASESSSFRHYATGCGGRVEIESEWTTQSVTLEGAANLKVHFRPPPGNAATRESRRIAPMDMLQQRVHKTEIGSFRHSKHAAFSWRNSQSSGHGFSAIATDVPFVRIPAMLDHFAVARSGINTNVDLVTFEP